MDAPWMDTAEAELGTRGFPGDKNNNPRVLEYLRTVAAGGKDEIAWCSAFANWVIKQESGSYPGMKGTGSPLARSWLHWGSPMAWPTYGAITVFWRIAPKGLFGHVGFYAGSEGDNLFVLGGNQGNTPGVVSVARFPKKRLLGFRWPYRLDYA